MFLEALPSNLINAFRHDLSAVQEAAAARVVPSHAAAAEGHWTTWSQFCRTLHLDPYLLEIKDPITILRVYAQCYRTGEIVPRHHAVQAQTVEDSLCAVGQAFAAMGANDPRLNCFGQVDFCIQ